MSSRSQAPEISLIVNTFMKPRHLGLVLDSIERQIGVEGRFEVVITDDGSTDETERLVAQRAAKASYRLAFTSRPHDGFRLARVRNDGVRIAHGQRFLFLDGDCMLPRDHVAVHLERCQQGVATGGDCGRLTESQSQGVDPTALDAAAIGQMLTSTEQAALRRKLRKWRWYSLIGHSTKPRLVGNNIGIHRHDFERINGFDERFVGWGQEDDDISLRLRAVGVRLETVLDSTCSLHVWHPTDPTATPRWRDGPNVQYFLRKGRLSQCRQGLVTRNLESLRWRFPPDLEQTALGRGIAEMLGTHAETRVPDDQTAEVDLVIYPGQGRFLPRKKTRQGSRGRHAYPECRVLLLADNPGGQGSGVPRKLRAAADVILQAPAFREPMSVWLSELNAVLEQVG
jgi:hypothetical protein